MESLPKSLYQRWVKLISGKIGFNLHYLIYNASWISFGQALEIAIGIGISIIFARLSSQETFGTYQYVFSLFSILSILSIPGINLAIVRSVAKGYEGVYPKGTGVSVCWSLLAIPILIGIGAYYFFFLKQEAIGTALFTSSLIFPFYYGLVTWISFLQGKSQFKRQSLYSAIVSLLGLIAIIGALFIDRKNVALIFGAFCGITALSNIYLFYKLNREKSNNKVDQEWKKQGFALTLITFVSNIYNYLDKLLIGIFLGLEQLAIYAIAVMIINKSRILFKTVNRVLFPKLVKKNITDITQFLTKKLWYLICILLVITVGMYLVLPYAIPLLYSSKYEQSVIFAQLYLITLPFSYFMSLFSSILIAVGKENKLVKIQLFSILVNILLYVLLIPRFGIIGAIISSFVYFVVFTIFAWRSIYKLANK